ncbi:transketolase [Clostridium grantii]|uniref:Transketolase n=1 Tax=Clostridium grantii DSM 8605 TaxID=1121316 RepID=A0A1M5UJL2_9CLOT|nr:transketolase [Clostridium grantii]SHH63110.1 transketolase [Clostridium grantii DSM 8605]
MNSNEQEFLVEKSRVIRRLVVDEIGTLGVGHIGGCLSPVEALVVLYYKEMNVDAKNPCMEGRDRFIMSKGHAGPTVYAILAEKGYFPMEELYTLNKPETNLPSHCDMLRTPGIDMTAGSLGQGFSCAVGIAKASQIKKDNAYIYAMIGDGESQEGQIWEAAMVAAQFKLNNLIAFTDYNKLQIDGTVEEVNGLHPLDKKWEAFGWNVIVVEDGHDVVEIATAVESAKTCENKPTMIILNTIKGKGVSFVEDKGAANHNMTFGEEEKIKALKELE